MRYEGGFRIARALEGLRDGERGGEERACGQMGLWGGIRGRGCVVAVRTRTMV